MTTSIVTSVRSKVYAARAKSTDHTVLEYSRDADQLREWKWCAMITTFIGELLMVINITSYRPSSMEARAIHPSDLRSHRLSHRMLGPCCLCPLVDQNGPDFVEAAIYIPSTGALSGEYVASCALRKCSYFGKSLEFPVNGKLLLMFINRSVHGAPLQQNRSTY
jgi:hypothetical protein